MMSRRDRVGGKTPQEELDKATRAPPPWVRPTQLRGGRRVRVVPRPCHATTYPKSGAPDRARRSSKRKPSGIPAGRALHDVECHSVSTRIRFPEPRCQHEQTSPTLPPSGLAADADGLGPPPHAPSIRNALKAMVVRVRKRPAADDTLQSEEDRNAQISESGVEDSQGGCRARFSLRETVGMPEKRMHLLLNFPLREG